MSRIVLTRVAKRNLKAGTLGGEADSLPKYVTARFDEPTAVPINQYLADPTILLKLNSLNTRRLVTRCLYRIRALEAELARIKEGGEE